MERERNGVSDSGRRQRVMFQRNSAPKGYKLFKKNTKERDSNGPNK